MSQTFDEIAPAIVAARLRDGDADLLLLDVREREELQFSRVEGALHIPMGEIAMRQQHIDADKHVVVMCHHGMRSAMVAAFLKKQGFERVSNLRRGIDAWSLEADASVPRY
ncbi:MAG: rhodanese-like domain-containing protein [Phycisphaerae bacterium]